MSKETLCRSKPEDLIRLAKWLTIETESFDHEQLAEEVYWKIQFGKPNK